MKYVARRLASIIPTLLLVSATIFWLVTGATLYWSLAIGLFVLDVATHI